MQRNVRFQDVMVKQVSIFLNIAVIQATKQMPVAFVDKTEMCFVDQAIWILVSFNSKETHTDKACNEIGLCYDVQFRYLIATHFRLQDAYFVQCCYQATFRCWRSVDQG